MHSINDNRGQFQAPHFEHIPLALRTGKHHVVWKAEARPDGKIGKTPYIARAALDRQYYRASSTKPRNWSTFDQAVKAYQRTGAFSGIGYVLTQHIIFIDIDHCLNPDGTPSTAAQDIITTLDSYTERSPSGDGVHIFTFGTLPADTQNIYHYQGHKIEVYTSGRYATLTGQPVPGTPLQDLQPRQAEVIAFLQRCSTAERENTSGGGVCGEVVADTDHQTPTPLFRTPSAARSGGTSPRSGSQQPVLRQAIREEALPPADQAILARARAAANGQNFKILWEGGDPKGRNDESKADFDLVLMLLYWSGDDAGRVERLFRASPRYQERQEKMERITAKKQYTYLQLNIYNAIQKRHRTSWRQPPVATPQPAAPLKARRPDPTPVHQAQRIRHAHQWTRQSETEDERQQKLALCAGQVAQRVEQHILAGKTGLLIATVAPGVGKSSTVAPLGERSTLYPDGRLNLAWIAERRDMVGQVEALKYYRQIAPCTKQNCPDHARHNLLGERGYNTWTVHKNHAGPCNYMQQFRESGSAVYQLAHVATRYPAMHQGIIIDELDIAKWLPERELSIDKLVAATRQFATGSTADLFLRCVTATITDAAQAKTALHGLGLFNVLNQRSGGHLANWIGELAQDPRYTNTHPWVELEEDDDDPTVADAAALTLAPVALPHLLKALMAELVKWQHGQEWNSCLRVGPGPHGWAIFLTERLDFTPGESGQLPARAILDATADAEILSLRFHQQIELVKGEIEPPPGMRHIAVRTGKRYGKTSLCTRRKDNKPNTSLARVIAEGKYLLSDLDPDGEARASDHVGLISFMGCVDTLGEALGIPEHRRLHFWAARGSNALEDCTILLIIGTPTVHPETVARLARALWQDDPQPISSETEIDAQGIRRYVDPRMERLNTYLTRAELTQCAHRSRALRHQGRTVVTLCLGNIDYLPATETITALPQLTPEGQERWGISRQTEHAKLDQAREQLLLEGKTLAMITVRELKAAANVSTDAAASYLRDMRGAAQPQEGQAHRSTDHTHTPLVFSPVPDSPKREIHSNVGYNAPPKTMPPPLRESPMEDVILEYARSQSYMPLEVDSIRIEAGPPAWYRFVWMPGPTIEQRRQVYEYILAAG